MDLSTTSTFIPPIAPFRAVDTSISNSDDIERESMAFMNLSISAPSPIRPASVISPEIPPTISRYSFIKPPINILIIKNVVFN